MSKPDFLFDPTTKRVVRAADLKPATDAQIALAGYDIPAKPTPAKKPAAKSQAKA